MYLMIQKRHANAQSSVPFLVLCRGDALVNELFTVCGESLFGHLHVSPPHLYGLLQEHLGRVQVLSRVACSRK